MSKYTPHDSAETSRIISQLPKWMKIHEPDSTGWQLMNALYGLPLEEIREVLSYVDSSRSIDTADPLEARQVYRVDFPDLEIRDIIDVSGYARVLDIDGVLIPIKLVDDARDFFEHPVTRWSKDTLTTTVAATPEYVDGDTTSLYSASGIVGLLYVPDHPTTPSGAYLINFNVPAIWPSSTVLYDAEFTPLSGYAFGVATQSFAVNGTDEVLDISENSPSGNLLHDPINLTIYDIINIDPSGNPREVPTGEYTQVRNSISFIDPSSLYIAEYTFQIFPHLKAINTPTWFHDMHRWDSSPILATDRNTGDGWETVPHEFGRSEPADVDKGILLRTDPVDLRPSGTAQVIFDYVRIQENTWEDPSASGISVYIEDPNFTSTDDNAYRLYDGEGLKMSNATYGPGYTSGRWLSASGSNLFDDYEFTGSSLWLMDGPDVEINTDGSFIQTGSNPGLWVASGSAATQRLPRPFIENTYVLTGVATASGYIVGDDEQPVSLIRLRGMDDEGEDTGSLAIQNNISAQYPDFVTFTKQVRLPLRTMYADIDVAASGNTLLYRSIKIEPYSLFKGDLSRRYAVPYRVDTAFRAQKTYTLDGVQSLSTPSGVSHPYPYDWTFVDRPHVDDGKVKTHIAPYTMLYVRDSDDAVVDELLPSGTLEQFTVHTRVEFTGLEIPPEDRILDENVALKIERFFLDRHQQTIHIQDMAGRRREIVPLFCPDPRKSGINERVAPSGGNYMYPSELEGEYPFIPYELHNDNPQDQDDLQAYREPRSIAYKDGDLYIVAAVTTASSTYLTRNQSPNGFTAMDEAIVYRVDMWDKVHRHLVPPSSAMYPLIDLVTNPTDCTWGKNGELLIAQSNTIVPLTPRYDVGIIDYNNQRGFFRESYVDGETGLSGVII